MFGPFSVRAEALIGEVFAGVVLVDITFTGEVLLLGGLIFDGELLVGDIVVAEIFEDVGLDVEVAEPVLTSSKDAKGFFVG